MRSVFTPPSGEQTVQMKKLEGNIRTFPAFARNHRQTNAAVAETVEQFDRAGKRSGSHFRMQFLIIMDKQFAPVFVPFRFAGKQLPDDA